jgi:hypothetical protein
MDKDVLAHWTYTRAEWKAFLRWKKWEQGILHYLFHRVTFSGSRRIPEVKITNYNVSTDDTQEVFIGLYRELRRVEIKDAGTMNVIEIIYEKKENKGRTLDEIRLPVPKGKLREAISLQHDLSEYISG